MTIANPPLLGFLHSTIRNGSAAVAPPAWTFRQQNNARNAGALDQSLAFITANTAAGTVFVFIIISGGSATFSNMRDSSGNSWTSLGLFADVTNTKTYAAFAASNATGGGKQTATVTVSANLVADVFLFEFAGVSVVDPDGPLVGTVSATRPIITPGFTSSPGAVWFTANSANGLISYNAPWTGFVDSNGNGAAYYITPGGPAAPNTGDSAGGSTGSVVFGLKTT